MIPSLTDLPEEIVVAIVEHCATEDLPAVARCCKQLSRLVPDKLYRHVYYRHVGIREEHFDAEIFYSDKHPPHICNCGDKLNLHRPKRTQNRWICGFCEQKSHDSLFNDADSHDTTSTWIVDLVRFVEIISQNQDRRNLVRTMRLDMQSPVVLTVEEQELYDTEPYREMWPWALNARLSETINSLQNCMAHLRFQIAFFKSDCHNGCANPRVMYTIGMPLPFLLLLPDYNISEDDDDCDCEACQTQGESVGQRHHCNFDVDVLKIDQSPNSQNVTDAPSQKPLAVLLYLSHYIGSVKNLEKIIGAPQEVEAYETWLSELPKEAFEEKSSKAAILRHLRSEFDRDEGLSDFPQISRFRNQLIGDVSSLISGDQVSDPIFKGLEATKSPNTIVLAHQVDSSDVPDDD